jgi:uncharacterized protein (DUF488 family)
MSVPPRPPSIFTVGHSNLDLTDYLQLVITHDINMIGDVRSRPRSYRHPQFNREPLEECLREAGLRYEFLGEALGGRPEDPRLYFPDGRVNYEARRKARDFQAEIDHVMQLGESAKIALMCAEEDPLQCHRFLMICPALLERGVAPVHVRRGGTLETQAEAEDRLLRLHNLEAFASGSLFAGERAEALQDALRRQANDFAFQTSPDALDLF